MNQPDMASPNQATTVLKLLWKRFLKQSWLFKGITLLVIVLTLIWMALFYTTFLIWQLLSLLLTKPLLMIIEWYLRQTDVD